MKYHIEGNGVLEGTPQEVAAVFSLLHPKEKGKEDWRVEAGRLGGLAKAANHTVSKRRKHKRGSYRRRCSECGGMFGKNGLGPHMYWVHKRHSSPNEVRQMKEQLGVVPVETAPAQNA